MKKCLHTCFKESGGQCIDAASVDAGTQLDRHPYCWGSLSVFPREFRYRLRSRNGEEE
jgi:hypothetical protein